MIPMTKFTIIFPSDPFGRKVGGPESYVNDIVRFAPADFEIEFIGITSDESQRPLKKWAQAKLGEKKFKFYPLCFVKDENKRSLVPLSLRFSLALKRCCLDFQNKVLFFNRIEPALFLRHIRTPKIGVIHNDIRGQMLQEGSEVFWSRFPWLYFKIEDIVFKSLERVFCVSRSTIDFYRTRYPYAQQKFSFLPTWTDGSVFFPVAEPKEELRKAASFAQRGLPVEKKWVLFVGRLQEQKAPLRLVDAFFEYRRKNPESCLIIIGDGNLKARVATHIRELKLEKDVFLLGQIDKKDLPGFYRASDVLLLTSNFEGMPLSVLEALACGLPVVSTDVGEVKSVVKADFCGEVAASFVPADIAAALDKILRNPSVYTKLNCLSCISEYTPQHVLKPLYEEMRILYREKCFSKGAS